METRGFFANDIGGPVEVIITHYFNNNTDNPYYERGKNIVFLDGIGASAILNALSNLPRSKEFNFDRVIHINFSKSENRRSLQRRIAEELNLGNSVMDIFYKQDVDDDFSGVEKSSRHEIRDVANHIFKLLIEERFLVIFRNGSDEEINLVTFGIPLFDWKDNKAVWTHQWPFPLNPTLKENVTIAHVIFRGDATELSNTELAAFVRGDATELARYTNIDAITPDTAMDCLFSLSWLHFNQVNFSGSEQETHVPNFWVCDGIIKGDGAWEAGSRLCEVMQPGHLPSREKEIKWFEDLSNLQENRSRWISITPRVLEAQSMEIIPLEATTCFVNLQDSDLPNKFFHQSSQLRVLKLSSCAFSFASPPFLYCQNLRFLGMDNCKDNGKTDELVQKQKRWTSLRSLWVMDLRHMDWAWMLTPQMIELMIELRKLNVRAVGVSRWSRCSAIARFKWPHNLRKFRVIECPMYLEVLLQGSFKGMECLELLDLSGNSEMEALPNMSAARSLKVLILDGCCELKNVDPSFLPASLESFSFDGFGQALCWKHSLQIPGIEERPSARETSQKHLRVSKISLHGLTRLKNVFLRGLPELKELNLSDTAVQALNLEAMQVQQLERLLLLGCEKLRRVQWHDISNPPLQLLCIDTTGNATRTLGYDCQGSPQDTSCPLAHIVVTEARLLRGFLSGEDPDSSEIVFGNQQFHLHLSSTVVRVLVKGTNKQKEISLSDKLSVPEGVGSSFPYLDVLNSDDVEEDGCSEQDCAPLLPLQRHIEISDGTCNLEILKDPDRLIVDSIMLDAESLHVHDHSSIGTASVDRLKLQFQNLRWCTVDRCPKMHTVFNIGNRRYPKEIQSFMSLEIFKASHLPEVQIIWSKFRFYAYDPGSLPAFGKLRYIRLHSCPSLKFVLPWSFEILPSLETIHISYCAELRHIFPNGEPYSGERATSIQFPSLKRIHLQEAPMLQQICETDMLAPALETIKLRGCWSLRRLPAIHNGRGSDKPLAVVDCEKDCWDKLEWDGLKESRNLFAPRHSRYCKMTKLRGSALR